jgi:hypothetical protein
MARKSQKKGRQDVPKGKKGKKGTAALPRYQTAVGDESSQAEQQSQPSQPLQSSRPEKTETNLAVGLQSTLMTFLAETPFGTETVCSVVFCHV